MTDSGPGPSVCSASLWRTYSSPEEARAVVESVGPENSGYVVGEREGAAVRFEVRSRSAPELQRTLDDLLACVSAAERTWSATRAGPGERAPPESDGDEGETDA